MCIGRELAALGHCTLKDGSLRNLSTAKSIIFLHARYMIDPTAPNILPYPHVDGRKIFLSRRGPRSPSFLTINGARSTMIDSPYNETSRLALKIYHKYKVDNATYNACAYMNSSLLTSSKFDRQHCIPSVPRYVTSDAAQDGLPLPTTLHIRVSSCVAAACHSCSSRHEGATPLHTQAWQSEFIVDVFRKGVALVAGAF